MVIKVPVIVCKSKKEAMQDLLKSIESKDLSVLSFRQKKNLLDQVVQSTRDIMHEQEKAFDQAIEHLDENNSVSVILDSEVSQLIEDGIKSQHDIMKSYM